MLLRSMLAGVCTVLILVGCTGSTPGSPDVSAAPAPVGSALVPGTYRSTVFATPLRFSVLGGWKVFEDEVDQFGLALTANDGPCLCVWRDVRASSTAEGCPTSPEPGVGSDAQAIADWLESNPGIAATGRQDVSIGGLEGVVLDINMAPGWTGTCSARGPDAKVPTLVGGSNLGGGIAWDVSASDSQRLYLLDLPDGGNIAINVEVCCGADFNQQTAAADAVIQSFVFSS